MILHAGEPGGIPSTWRSPTTRRPGGNIPHNPWPRLPGLPPGRRVVALGEVGGMPHPTTSPTGLGAGAGHPGDLPARRGYVLFGDRAGVERK